MKVNIQVLQVLAEHAHFALSPDSCTFYAWYLFRNWKIDAWGKTEDAAVSAVADKLRDYFQSQGIIAVKTIECQL